MENNFCIFNFSDWEEGCTHHSMRKNMHIKSNFRTMDTKLIKNQVHIYMKRKNIRFGSQESS